MVEKKAVKICKQAVLQMPEIGEGWPFLAYFLCFGR